MLPRAPSEDSVALNRCMEWIDLDQNRDKWKALVNVVMNRWVP
jgi:hypothetical protein